VHSHGAVVRLMREDTLRCLRTRGFVRITDSAHPLAVSPNLRPELTVDGLNQLWVAAMTYVHLPQAFVSLGVHSKELLFACGVIVTARKTRLNLAL
jgi:putative transposase